MTVERNTRVRAHTRRPATHHAHVCEASRRTGKANSLALANNRSFIGPRLGGEPAEDNCEHEQHRKNDLAHRLGFLEQPHGSAPRSKRNVVETVGTRPQTVIPKLLRRGRHHVVSRRRLPILVLKYHQGEVHRGTCPITCERCDGRFLVCEAHGFPRCWRRCNFLLNRLARSWMAKKFSFDRTEATGPRVATP